MHATRFWFYGAFYIFTVGEHRHWQRKGVCCPGQKFMLPTSPSRSHSKCVTLQLMQRMFRDPSSPVKVRRATPTASRAVFTHSCSLWAVTAFLSDSRSLAGCCSAMSWQAGLGQRSKLHSTAAVTDVMDTLVGLNNSIDSSETLLQWWSKKCLGISPSPFFSVHFLLFPVTKCLS